MKRTAAANIIVLVAAVLLSRAAAAQNCGAVCQEMEHISTQAPLLAETIRSTAEKVDGGPFLDRLESLRGELKSSRDRCEDHAGPWAAGETCKEIESVVERYNDITGDYSLALLDQAGLEAFTNDDYARALHACTLAIGLDPGFARAYLIRGASHAAMGQHDPAISDLTKSIELDPQGADAYLQRAACYLRKGRNETAISDFTRAIDLGAEQVGACFHRGGAYAREGRHDLAISDYTRTIELMLAAAGAARSNDVARVYHERGLAWRSQGDLDRAIADFAKALELNPAFALAHYERGLTWRDRGSLDRAIADFSEALEGGIPREQKPWAYYNRGLAWRDKADLDRAIADFTEAIYLQPSISKAHSHRGLARLAKQDSVRGCFDLQKACEAGSCEELELEQNEAACGEVLALLPVREVRVSHILLESSTKARALLRRINLGESFEDLAREHSTCPSRHKGGDLGFFGKGQMVKEFEDAAFTTPKGIVTGPVLTKFGCHLIKVTDTRQ